MTLSWSDLTFPAINLWNAPYMQPKQPKPTGTIVAIRGQDAIDYMEKLRKIDKMKPISVSIQDFSWK